MFCSRCNDKVKRIAVDIYKCPSCGFIQFRDGSECDLDESEYRQIYKTGPDRPIGCAACDSDTWPICKEGCPMYDD